MHKNKPLTVVVACDNEYIVLLAALVKSIETHTKERAVNLYIIENNISRRNQVKLIHSVQSPAIRLIWKNAKTVVPPKMSIPVDRSSYPVDIYMRLFIPYCLPEDIEKILYLDVDTVVQQDIGALLDTELGNHILAAVQDPRVKTFDNSWGGIKNYRELGFKSTCKYFNTGVLLMNLPQWRKEHITEKVFACIKANKQFANYPDQYGLNIVLANQWMQLAPQWNHFADVKNGAASIIHYISRKPIYTSYSNLSSFREIFFQYLNQTEWQGFKAIGEPARYFKILKNLVSKRLA